MQVSPGSPSLRQRRRQNIISLSDRGMVANDTSTTIRNQNTAALQALADELFTGRLGNEGEKILVPRGYFYMAAGRIVWKCACILEGVGSDFQGGSRFIWPAASDGFLFDADTAGIWTSNGITLRNLGLTGAGSWWASNRQKPAPGIHNPLASTSAHNDGHDPLAGNGIVARAVFTLHGCLISGWQYDGVFADSMTHVFYNSNYSKIYSCHFQNNGRHGISACGGDNAQVWDVRACSFELNAGFGWMKRAFYGDEVSSCHFQGNGYYAGDVSSIFLDTSDSLNFLDTVTCWAGFNGQGIFRSWDPYQTTVGIQWRQMDNGITVTGLLKKVTGFALVSATGGTQDNRVLTCTDGGGVYRAGYSSNPDAWNKKNSGLTDTAVKSIASNGTTTVYAATPSGVFKSTDSGDTWSLSSNFTGAAYALLMVGSTLYIGGVDGLWKSTDALATAATRIDTSAQVNSIAAVGTSILVGTASGVRYSTDTGGTFAGGLSGNVACTAITVNDKWLAGVSTGVQRSTNQGGAWTLITSGIHANNRSVSALCAHPTDDNVVFLGVSQSSFTYTSQTAGLYKSANAGVDWFGGSSTDVKSCKNTFYGGAVRSMGPYNSSAYRGCYYESDEINGFEVDNPGLVDWGVASTNAPLPRYCNGAMESPVPGIGFSGMHIRAPRRLKQRKIVRGSGGGTSVYSSQLTDQEILFDASGGGGPSQYNLPDPVTDTTWVGGEITVRRVEPITTSPLHNLEVAVANAGTIGDGTKLRMFGFRARGTFRANTSDWSVIDRDPGSVVI